MPSSLLSELKYLGADPFCAAQEPDAQGNGGAYVSQLKSSFPMLSHNVICMSPIGRRLVSVSAICQVSSRTFTSTSWCPQARLPEIEELEKQIKATNEELADAQFKAREDTARAAGKEKALQEKIDQAEDQVRLRGVARCACCQCHCGKSQL